MDADRLLLDLDDRQRAAVTTESRLVAVIASAGAGKTRVLSRRIAYRIAAATADARHTLALTFTREAAGELRRRLHRAGLREPVEAGTFHSVALAILRQRWRDTDRPTPSILNDPRRLLAEVAEGVPLDVLAAERAWLAARGIESASYRDAARAAARRCGVSHDRITAALARYDELKRRRRVIDLDDLLTTLVGEASRDADFVDVMRWRFRHVLVDEAQDLNPAQYRMLRVLTDGRHDLFLVGDPAQAIYGFNGSDPALLVEVDRHLPGVEIIRLPSNHRCTPQIVAAGMHVLRAAGQPAGSVSARDPGPPLELIVAADEGAEAAMVARRLLRCPARHVQDGHVAVLARTHEQLGGLRRELDRSGVPVRRDALAPGTALALAVRQAAVLPSASRLRAWAHDVIDVPPPAGGVAMDETEAAERRAAAAVLDFLRENALGDGAGFRSWVASTRPFAERDDGDGVDLLTFHAAKGREWHTVVVTGVETGLVPHKSAATVEARAEEARLLHVAVTRASDVLVVTRAERRRGYSRQPSPYLAGLEFGTAGDEPAPVPDALVSVAHDVSITKLRVETLHAWRESTARATALLPAQICSEADLAAIAASPPSSPAELAALAGFGPVTAARHFRSIRAALEAAGRTA